MKLSAVGFDVFLTVTIFMFNPWPVLCFLLLRGLAHQCGQNPLGLLRAALCIVSSHTISVNQGLGEWELMTYYKANNRRCFSLYGTSESVCSYPMFQMGKLTLVRRNGGLANTTRILKSSKEGRNPSLPTLQGARDLSMNITFLPGFISGKRIYSILLVNTDFTSPRRKEQTSLETYIISQY